MTGGDARRLVAVVVLVLVVVVCVVIVVVVLGRKGTQPYVPAAYVFDGPSDKLALTVIVPTLDTPMPADKNVIWCASFQLAWNEFRDDVIGEPVKITGAQEIADRLNASTITGDILEPDDYYAKAGFAADGTVEHIREDMTAQLPDVTLPDFAVEDPNLVAVAYAYLQVSVEFAHMFHDNRDEFLFRGVPVTSFGIRETDTRPDDPARNQVLILYSSEKEDEPWSDENEFIIDLSMGTRPYEIVLARVERKATLAEMLADVERKTKSSESFFYYRLDHQDVLLVPNMNWRVEHRFSEIEGVEKLLLNEGHGDNWLGLASQMIQFKLDRAGALLRSEARIEEVTYAGRPRRFVFDKPFLILMRKREGEKHPSDYATQPFFVMWVENAELLCKR
jgi:hypothetical protein